MSTLHSQTPRGEALVAMNELREWVERQGFCGYDPYDALNSPFLRLASLGMKWPRIAVTQAMKRSPWNLRPFLGVAKGYNPKGIALFLWSYAKIYAATGDQTARAQAYALLDLLNAARVQTPNGSGWGYNFDWQSRAFYLPKGTPTVVNSSFAGHALLDAHRIFADDRFLEVALPIRGFILRDLNRTPAEDGAFCFSYTPIDQTIVHNASLLGASLVARLDALDPVAGARDAALNALGYSMGRQREDGSWWYADTDYQQWIDSFHTGFNLQCVRWFLDLGLAEEHRAGYARGVEFYAREFFEPDGTARYFHDARLPEDIHSYAQAIVFFAAEGAGYSDLVQRVTNRMLSRFRDPSGYFYFQRRKGQPIRIPYMRWAQSWALHALSQHLIETRPGNAT